MKFAPSFPNDKGFSLVELMIVVGIIGILGTLALPRFKQFQAKAKMGEAKNILTHIYTLEQTYSLDNNTFMAFGLIGRPATGVLTAASCAPNAQAQAIGFRIDPCAAGGNTPRYGYSVVAGGAGIVTSFLATATSGGAAAANPVCPGNPAHTFSLTEGNVLGGATAGSAEPQVGIACPD
jgi:prepilin-type N-terminal cleavage/methylation domain-containing protein